MDYRTWPTYSLREVGTIVTGSTPSTKDPENYSFEDYCFIKPSDISNSGISAINDSEYHISRKAFSQSRRLPAGSVLTTCIGIIGKVGILQKEATCNQQINALIPNRGFDPSFLAYAILSKKIELQEIANAPVVPIINKKTFSELRLRIPELPVQLSIAKELNLLAEIIDKKNAQLRDLDALAQSIFYELFGDPSAAFYGRSDSALRIGDFSKCIAGATPSTKVNSYWSNGTIPWLSSGEVAKGRVFATDTMISQEGYDSCSTRLVPKNSVLIAMAGQGKTRGSVGISGIELCTNQSICSIIVNDKIILPDYLYYELKLLYNELRSISNGDGGRGGLNLKLIQGFLVIVPDIDEQMTFVKRAKAIETQKTLIQDSLIQAKKLLDSRMSYYFG